MTSKKRGLFARIIHLLRALLAPLRERATKGSTRPPRDSPRSSRGKG